MKVQVEGSAVPEGEAEFDQIFRANWSRLVRYTEWVLKAPGHPHAEDMAQEAFIELWRHYLAPTATRDLRQMETVYGLLKVMARHRVHNHFRACRNQEATVDMADQASRDLETGHGYAAGMPGVSMLVAELETAMERMTAASEKWRNLNKESARLRLLLADNYRDHLGGLSAYNRAEFERRAEETEQQEETALSAFRQTCLKVGQLRAEIERTAGPNWRSSIGLPPSQAWRGGLSYAKDSAATHCSKGHLLDRLNTAFTAEGERRCRTCGREKNLRLKPRTTASTAGAGTRAAVDADVIERARELLADPALKHSIRSVSELLGVAQMTLYRAFPGGVKAVRSQAQQVLEGADR